MLRNRLYPVVLVLSTMYFVSAALAAMYLGAGAGVA